jgi:hypothetical protein
LVPQYYTNVSAAGSSSACWAAAASPLHLSSLPRLPKINTLERNTVAPHANVVVGTPEIVSATIGVSQPSTGPIFA